MKTKEELLKYIGRIEQVGGVKEYMLTEGKSKGMKAIDIDTGLIRFTILPDRCLDIAHMSYKSIPISWISRVGLTAPEFYEKEGLGWLRSFFGGLVTTCGLKNIGKPSDGVGLHGRISNTPAEKLSISEEWTDGKYVMAVSGKMRESVIFGENLVLRRTIKAVLGEARIVIEDEIENVGHESEEYAICYHCNFGYPLVSENARIIGIPQEFSSITRPTKGASEECIAVDFTDHDVEVGIENGGLGAYIKYSRDLLDDFLVWKMQGQGDYVIGLEPRTSSLNGIEEIRESGKSKTLSPQETVKSQIEFIVKECSSDFSIRPNSLFNWLSQS
jgi:hypothetical protein